MALDLNKLLGERQRRLSGEATKPRLPGAQLVPDLRPALEPTVAPRVATPAPRVLTLEEQRLQRDIRTTGRTEPEIIASGRDILARQQISPTQQRLTEIGRPTAIRPIRTTEELLPSTGRQAGLQRGIAKAFLPETSFVQPPTGLLGQAIEQKIEQQPEGVKGAEIVGRLIGTAAQYVTVSKAIAPLIKTAGLTGAKAFAAKQGADLLVDNIVQLPGEVIDSIKNDKTLTEDAKRIAWRNVIDIGFNAAVGIPEMVKLYRTAKNSGVADEVLQSAVDSLPDATRRTIQQELGLEEGVTAQQFLKEQEQLAKELGVEVPTKPIAEAITPTTEIPRVQRDIPIGQAEVGLKNRQFVENTMLNADVVPAAVKEELAQNIPKYTPISNVETFANAQGKVSRNFDQALSEFDSLKSLRNADDTALGEALIVEAINKGELAKSIDISTQLAERLTELGQAVQAASIMKRLSPQGMLQYASKQINKAVGGIDPSVVKKADEVIKQVDDVLKTTGDMNSVEKILKEFGLKMPEGGVTPENLQAVVKEQLKIPNLSTEDAQIIIDGMRRIEGMPDGREKDVLLNQVMQHIANKIPSTGAEKVKAFLRMSMLLNPKTLLTRNPLGNTIFGALENVSQVPSGLVDIATSKVLKTPRLTPVVPNVKNQISGFAEGLADMFDDIRKGVDTAVTRGGVELPRSKTVFHNKPLDAMHNFMGTLLQLGDRPFFQAAYKQRMDELVKLTGNAEPTSEMIADATQFATSRVFQDKTAYSEFGQSLKKAMNKANIKGIGAGDIVLPFVQTPANIFGKSIEYTPLGVLKAFKEAPTLNKIAKGTFNQKAFTDAIGRTMTGTGIATLGYKLAEAGLMTGKPQGAKAETALERAAGQSAYAVKFGDTWYTFDWAQPASTPLAVGADFYEAGKSESDLMKQTTKGLISGGDTLFRQSFLQGMQRLMGGYSPTTGIVSTVAQAPLQAFPTAGSQVAKFADPVRRVVTGDTPFETAANVAKLKTPGLRQTLEPQLDVFGQEVLESQGRRLPQKAFETFLAPGFKTEESKDPTIQEVVRLHDETGENQVLPKIAKDFTHKGETIELTPKEKTSMQRQMGQETKTRLDTLLRSLGYKNATEEARADMIGDIIDSAYGKAKENILKGRGIK